MKYPFIEQKKGDKILRSFSSSVSSAELVWHRDKKDRTVKIVEGTGWKLQLENQLPIKLCQNETYHIPKNTYHRVIKGKTELVVEIKEENSMKLTKKQLQQIIKEEIATINDDAIEDTVLDVLSDEGGAAGLEPIEDALEDLEDDEMSLPDEPIEDVISGVAGVKRHADGDYVDTTQLEGRKIKITKRQLRQLVMEATPGELGQAAAGGLSPADQGMAAAQDDDRLRRMGIDPNLGLFDEDYLYDLFYDDFALVQPTAPTVPEEAFDRFEDALAGAVRKLKRDLT